MYKPVRNIVLIRAEKKETKILMLDDKEKNHYNFIIEEVGEEVKLDIKKGDKVLTVPHSFKLGNDEKEYENLFYISEQDIWAVEKQ